MGILGEAMNLPDGRVRILASADPVMLEKFTSMLYGCPRVIIRDMQILPHTLIEFDGFSILRGESQYIT